MTVLSRARGVALSRRARTGCRGHISVAAPARSPPSGRPALFGRRYLRAEPHHGVVGMCAVANAHVTRGGYRACGPLTFWKAGRSGRGRRPRCHGAARAWRASEHEPGERQWAQRSDRPSMNAQGGTTSGSNESAAEGRRAATVTAKRRRDHTLSLILGFIFAKYSEFDTKSFEGCC